VKILFHFSSSSPGGVGEASGYLYLKPGALFETFGVGIELDGSFLIATGCASDWSGA
jgi:hypothetical protein